MTATDPAAGGGEQLTPDEEAKFGRFLEQHNAREKAKADRRKEPKDFGEVLDRLSDEVVDKIGERFGLSPVDDQGPPADDAPSAGGGGKVTSFLFGRPGSKAAGE